MNCIQLRSNRFRIDLELRDSVFRKYFSPAVLCLECILIPRLRRHVSGKLLDAGCGAMPFKPLLKNLVDEYCSIDIEPRVPEVDFVGDLQDMKELAGDSYNVVLCTEVLEHVPQPDKLIAEAWRVLAPRGKFILSVPHLSRLHEEPFDYFRFTKHGLQFLLEQKGFDVLEIVPTGSVFSFLGHQASTVFVGFTWHVPIVKYLVFFLNALLCTLPCYALDMLLPISAKVPLGYVVVAQKSTQKQLDKRLQCSLLSTTDG